MTSDNKMGKNDISLILQHVIWIKSELERKQDNRETVHIRQSLYKLSPYTDTERRCEHLCCLSVKDLVAYAKEHHEAVLGLDNDRSWLLRRVIYLEKIKARGSKFKLW